MVIYIFLTLLARRSSSFSALNVLLLFFLGPSTKKRVTVDDWDEQLLLDSLSTKHDLCASFFLIEVNNIRTQSSNNLSSPSIGSSCPHFFPILHSLFQCVQQLQSLATHNTGGSPVGRGRSPQCSCQFGRHGTHSLLPLQHLSLRWFYFPLGDSLLLLPHIERTRSILFISGYYSGLLITSSFLKLSLIP